MKSMDLKANNVLFVDDEEYIIALLRRLFANEEFSTFFATSGADGLEILGNQRIDLVISDIEMPSMNGVDFLKEVSTRHPSTIRYFMTGSKVQKMINKALSKGYVQRILPKPWNSKLLKEAVRDGLRQAKQLSSN